MQDAITRRKDKGANSANGDNAKSKSKTDAQAKAKASAAYVHSATLSSHACRSLLRDRKSVLAAASHALVRIADNASNSTPFTYTALTTAVSKGVGGMRPLIAQEFDKPSALDWYRDLGDWIYGVLDAMVDSSSSGANTC